MLVVIAIIGILSFPLLILGAFIIDLPWGLDIVALATVSLLAFPSMRRRYKLSLAAIVARRGEILLHRIGYFSYLLHEVTQSARSACLRNQCNTS